MIHSTKYILLFSFILYSTLGWSQFASSGEIEFVKKTNMHLAFKLEFGDRMGDRMDQMLKMFPKNATKHYVMTFNENKSMYRYDKDGPEKVPNFGGKDPGSENIVYVNFKDNTYKAQKEVFDKTLLVVDSIPKFRWKIHDQIRQIAGYNCRKATTTLGDSLVVIAFYCDDIMVSGGPESLSGLPGMILGVAVPRLYSTWFATKVTFTPYNEALEKPLEEKGDQVTIDNQTALLDGKLNKWGGYAKQIKYKLLL